MESRQQGINEMVRVKAAKHSWKWGNRSRKRGMCTKSLLSLLKACEIKFEILIGVIIMKSNNGRNTVMAQHLDMYDQ